MINKNTKKIPKPIVEIISKKIIQNIPLKHISIELGISYTSIKRLAKNLNTIPNFLENYESGKKI